MSRERAIRFVADLAAVQRAAADELIRIAEETLKSREVFNVVLSGGTTPRGLYALLAEDPVYRDRVAWEKVHFFFSDERHVPPEDPASNYGMVAQALLSRIPTPPTNVHRFRCADLDPPEAAELYEMMLRNHFGLVEGEVPRFDLVLLGMGRDGHTASIFPGSPALGEGTRLAVAVEATGNPKVPRITLTPVVLKHAAVVVFLVSGADKAETLRDVLEGDPDPDRLPAQAIRPLRGTVLWIVDRAAAQRLESASS